MSRSFSCTACGHLAHQWFGRCPDCGEWSTAVAPEAPGLMPVVSSLGASETATPRLITGIGEVDRVLGGGLVSGGVVLLAGEPGIGKSTLVLQLIDSLMSRQGRALLVTGEESPDQVALRAARLELALNRFRVAASTSLPAVVAAAESERPDLLVVDSIQALTDPTLDQGPGSVVQVRDCAARLVAHAKGTGTAVVLVGHVTKEGSVAGPKTLEHMVDAVITLEGERTSSLRVLRSAKNRFGSCEEIGVFVMRERGLAELEDPSALFLSDRREGVSGSVVSCSLEGSRPLLVEMQALVPTGSPSQPRRVAGGIDHRRLSLLLGVLAQHASLVLTSNDVFVAAAGGIAVREPAVDLALCLALFSAARNIPAPDDTVVIGEVGLGGEVRRVPGIERRLAEAARLGFGRAIIPAGAETVPRTMDVVVVRDLPAARDAAFRRPTRIDQARSA
ncbi:MAG: DNA repair protein RadA [Actinomycetota bacterium]